MRELTLDQMGKEISAAIQTLSLARRKAIGELLLIELRKPVGTLRRDG
jgi:hypothetical protein